mmetsp:Transcript_21822/g.60471  ORF Transcript_21822/g.60471 Transcript_21822/m.60471 type:complete len:226 (-) Transcript_21822:575-1252(-)
MHLLYQLVVLGALHLAVAVHQQLLGKVQAVAGGQHGDEALLGALVIQYSHLLRVRRPKLLPLCAVPDGDAQRPLQSSHGATAQPHSPACELAQRGSKPAALACQWRAVPATLVHASKPVQQIDPGDADVCEADGTVVHTIQADLVAAVMDLHSRQELASIIAQGHDECVHTMVHQSSSSVGVWHFQPGKHSGHLPILCSIPNPPLNGALVRCVDYPLVCLHIKHS